MTRGFGIQGRRTMTSRRALIGLSVPLLLVAACSGGRSGTGISESVSELVTSQPGGGTAPSSATAPAPTAADPGAATAAAETVVSMIAGNVSSIQLAAARPGSSRASTRTMLATMRGLLRLGSAAHAGTGLDGIMVTVEGADGGTETDPNGNFSLDGGYSGPAVLHFDRAEDGLSALMGVSVPKGGSLSLGNVNLDGTTGKASAESQDLRFDGLVVDAKCAEHQMTSASRADPQGPKYVVDLSSSSLRDSSGRRLGCLQLHEGDGVQVQGLVQTNGSIGDANVVVEDRDQAESTATAAMSRLPHSTPALGIPLPSGP